VSAQQSQPPKAGEPAGNGTTAGSQPPFVFDMGQINVVGSSQEGQPVVGGSVLSSEQIWMFDRKSLDQAVNVVPDVISTIDANGRRNESNIYVRGFDRGRSR